MTLEIQILSLNRLKDVVGLNRLYCLPFTFVLTDGDYSNIYLGIVWVFSSISGLITFLPDGRIQSINENFSRLLFGYNSDELIGQVICFHLICFSDCL